MPTFDSEELLRQDLLNLSALWMNLRATTASSRPAATVNIADEGRLRVCIAANLFARQGIP